MQQQSRTKTDNENESKHSGTKYLQHKRTDGQKHRRKIQRKFEVFLIGLYKQTKIIFGKS
jgi:hypothetical protein